MHNTSNEKRKPITIIKYSKLAVASGTINAAFFFDENEEIRARYTYAAYLLMFTKRACSPLSSAFSHVTDHKCC